MSGSGCISALLDTSALRYCETITTVLEEQIIKSATSRQTVKVLRFKARPRLDSQQQWKQKQIDAMPTIAGLARTGSLQLFRYTQLINEILMGSLAVPDTLLKGVHIGDVPAAVERSKWPGFGIFDSTPDKLTADKMKELFVKFCKFLLALNHAALEARPRLLSRFTSFERQNLRSLKRFREICRPLQEPLFPDAFHLWTAEANGLNYFLTADRAFINAMKKTSRTRLKCEPIAPADLLHDLGIVGSTSTP